MLIKPLIWWTYYTPNTPWGRWIFQWPVRRIHINVSDGWGNKNITNWWIRVNSIKLNANREQPKTLSTSLTDQSAAQQQCAQWCHFWLDALLQHSPASVCISIHQSTVSNLWDVLCISKALCNYARFSVGALIKSSSVALGFSKISTQPSVLSVHQTGKVFQADSSTND